MRSKNIAFFPDGLYGFFIRPHAGLKLQCLAEKGSPDETWVQSWSDYIPVDPSSSPDASIAATCKKHKIGYFLPGNRNAAFIRKWSHDTGIRPIGFDPALYDAYENKIRFHRFLEKHDLPHPAGKEIKFDRKQELAGPSVLQKGISTAGSGTYFVDSWKDVKQLLDAGELNTGDTYLLRPFVPGASYGISVFVTSGGTLLSALRQQMYQDRRARIFTGIQWLPAGYFSPRTGIKIRETFTRLATILRGKKQSGHFNFDFIVDAKGNILITECNVGPTSATAQLAIFPSLTSGIRAYDRLVNDMNRNIKTAGRIFLLPRSGFRGAVLSLLSPVKKDCRSGLYALKGTKAVYLTADITKVTEAKNRFIIYIYPRPVTGRAPCYGTVYGNAPLFRVRGGLSNAGKIITGYCSV